MSLIRKVKISVSISQDVDDALDEYIGNRFTSREIHGKRSKFVEVALRRFLSSEGHNFTTKNTVKTPTTQTD